MKERMRSRTEKTARTEKIAGAGMNRRGKRIAALIAVLIVAVSAMLLAGYGKGAATSDGGPGVSESAGSVGYEGSADSSSFAGSDGREASSSHEALSIDESGSYTTKEDVALYIHVYGRLPNNFITKDEARSLGWEGGGFKKIAPDKCIGGDVFGNYEGALPEKKGRIYRECDVDTLGAGSRGAKRIVFSDDGLIYYTEDHYETFELLYGEE